MDSPTPTLPRSDDPPSNGPGSDGPGSDGPGSDGPGSDGPPRPARAVALPPDERRAAIIKATLPLVLEHGTAVPTRLIALAAGIAEGTIFRVFPDKESLIDAVVEAAFDPEPTEAALAEIDPSLPFEERLTAAVAIVQRRLESIWRLTSTVGAAKTPPERHRVTDLEGLIAIFRSRRGELEYEPVVAARMLRGLTLATSHPALIGDVPMTPSEIVSLLLDGIRSR